MEDTVHQGSRIAVVAHGLEIHAMTAGEAPHLRPGGAERARQGADVAAVELHAREEGRAPVGIRELGGEVRQRELVPLRDGARRAQRELELAHVEGPAVQEERAAGGAGEAEALGAGRLSAQPPRRQCSRARDVDRQVTSAGCASRRASSPFRVQRALRRAKLVADKPRLMTAHIA
jgi:hypothetical protein